MDPEVVVGRGSSLIPEGNQCSSIMPGLDEDIDEIGHLESSAISEPEDSLIAFSESAIIDSVYQRTEDHPVGVSPLPKEERHTSSLRRCTFKNTSLGDFQRKQWTHPSVFMPPLSEDESILDDFQRKKSTHPSVLMPPLSEDESILDDFQRKQWTHPSVLMPPLSEDESILDDFQRKQWTHPSVLMPPLSEDASILDDFQRRRWARPDVLMPPISVDASIFN